LVAACVEAHPKHTSSLSWLKRAKNKEIEYIVSAHSLVEVYSVLTSAPFKPQISPATAKKLIEGNIKKAAKIISLSEKDYFRIIENMDKLGLKGGIVYDAIIVECARKSKSGEIITSNVKDFSRLIPDDSIKIIAL
jgi:predicted nucleic acid-binding protein